MRQAAWNRSGPISPLEGRNGDAVWPARQKTLKVRLAEVKRQTAEIVAAYREHIEGVELHLVVVLARVQRVEI